jgi:hypothetical protein
MSAVPEDDLPKNLVPQSDLPKDLTEETYDPREKVGSVMPAAGGAAAAAIGPSIVKKGTEAIKKGRAAAPVVASSAAAPGSALADIEQAMTKGLSNEITQQTRTAQRAARTEDMSKILAELKAKGVSVDPKLLAQLPSQYARPESGVLLNVETAKDIAAAEDAAKAAANVSKTSKLADTINFLKGAVDYRIPFTQIRTGPLLGRGLVGAGAGIQGADAYNRAIEGDIPGSVISGLGAVGTASSLLPYAPAKVIGAGVGLSAEAINAYRDAMRKGKIEHGAPEDYSRTDAMGNMYAQGGRTKKFTIRTLPPGLTKEEFVHLCKGGHVEY